MADDIKWIKLSTGILDDEKIIDIESMEDGCTLCWMWIKLLALAGRQNADGKISLTDEIPYTDVKLANRFRMSEETVRIGLDIFRQYGMIEIVDDFIYTSNWTKYQNQESLERIREKNREYVRRHREKQKQQKCEALHHSESLPEIDAGIEAGFEPGEVRRIQEDHNAILDLAERIGIVTRDWDRDQIIDLYGQYGREVVEYALTESGKNNKKNLKYIEAICKNYGKPKSQEEDPIDAAARRFAEKEAAKRDK